jgi:small-conductance mechanosensitive channel
MHRPLRRALGSGASILLPVVLAAVVAAAVPPAATVRAAQPPSTGTTDTTRDPEAESQHPAPVLLGGEPIIWVTSGAGPYTPEFRADRISQRLQAIVRDRSISNPTVTVTDTGDSSELRVGAQLLMVVTQRDARTLGVARSGVAQQYAGELERAIRAERLRYAPATLVRSGILGLLATLVVIAAIWLIRRITRWMHGAIERWRARGLESFGRLATACEQTIRVIRLALIGVAIILYMMFVLALFPWTRAVSRALIGYLLTPVGTVGAAVVGYLPKLLFVLVIGAVVHFAIRMVGLLFRQVEQGRLVVAHFPPEWADPTNKIVRVLLIAFGIVVAFPYLPASDSPAFAGVSVFLGVLVSLTSGSALANMIAGIVLTYTGAFRLGDRVKLGDAFGDIVETSLLATHVRTIKNEEITIPNSIVLGSAVTNYTRIAEKHGLILHTSVTIGYDAPWRTIHDLLVSAALATPGIMADPSPFVWQTALNDFYVTYEINAYTATPRDMIDIYAALHAKIQDTFYQAGVEIMSPHFTSVRDGNTVAIPEAFRAPGYQPPAFRIQDTSSPTALLRENAGLPRRG